MHAVVAFEELLDFFQVPAVADIHEFDIFVVGGEFLPHAVQEFQVLFFRNAPDEGEPYGAFLAGVTVFFPGPLPAYFGREPFQRESARGNLHLFFGHAKLLL